MLSRRFTIVLIFAVLTSAIGCVLATKEPFFDSTDFVDAPFANFILVDTEEEQKKDDYIPMIFLSSPHRQLVTSWW
jgi:hypothetical protein